MQPLAFAGAAVAAGMAGLAARWWSRASGADRGVAAVAAALAVAMTGWYVLVGFGHEL